MPLEDLTGNKYISDLNSAWPDGAFDTLDGADNHLRGIKNVLKKTFPNLSGPVTATQSVLNTGSIPAGAVMYFYNSVAPTGWTRQTAASSYMLRIVAGSSAGGVQGGSHDPILNDKVASHTHTVSGSTGSQSDTHTHTFTTSLSGSHSHTYNGGTTGLYPGYVAVAGLDMSSVSTSSAGAHTHSGTTSSDSHTHSHAVSLTSAANGSASTWQPRYRDIIQCIKT